MKTVILVMMALGMMAGCSACSSKGTPTDEYNDHLVTFNKKLVDLGYMPIDFSQLVIKKDKDLEAPTFGRCQMIALKNKGPTEIVIGKRAFGFNEKQMMLLIYHEIGHCYFGLTHTEEKRKLMNSNSNQAFQYTELNDDQFVKSLIKEMVENSGYNLLKLNTR